MMFLSAKAVAVDRCIEKLLHNPVSGQWNQQLSRVVQ
jgi:hypothetical protein